MYNFIRIQVIILVLLIVACSGKYDADNGFDKICLIYTDVFTNPLYSNKPLMEKHEIVNNLIKVNVFDVDAITAFTAVASADPDLKYDLFKQSAEYSLKREWDCQLLKEL